MKCPICIRPQAERTSRTYGARQRQAAFYAASYNDEAMASSHESYRSDWCIHPWKYCRHTVTFQVQKDICGLGNRTCFCSH
ncbi:hypothetical protein D3C80_1111270 [compost metagenome]